MKLILCSITCLAGGLFLARQFRAWWHAAPGVDRTSFAWRLSRGCLPSGIGMGSLGATGLLSTILDNSSPRSAANVALAAGGLIGFVGILLGFLIGFSGHPTRFIPRAMREADDLEPLDRHAS